MREFLLLSHLVIMLTYSQGCGENLYTDVNKRSEAEITRLASILQCTPGAPSRDSTGRDTNTIPINRPPLAMIPGRSSSSSSSSLGLSSSLMLGSSPSTSLYAMGTSASPGKSYLELCINAGEYTKTLSEIDLVHAGCDGELFRKIRSEYLRLRSFRSKIWLLKPSGVHFVKVYTYSCTFISQLTSFEVCCAEPPSSRYPPKAPLNPTTTRSRCEELPIHSLPPPRRSTYARRYIPALSIVHRVRPLACMATPPSQKARSKYLAFHGGHQRGMGNSYQ